MKYGSTLNTNKCIFITTWATEICWNCFLKFNYLDHRYNQGIQTVHMDLVTDGGACFPRLALASRVLAYVYGKTSLGSES